MTLAKAKYLANALNERMDRSSNPILTAELILEALTDYRALVMMVNSFPLSGLRDKLRKLNHERSTVHKQ